MGNQNGVDYDKWISMYCKWVLWPQWMRRWRNKLYHITLKNIMLTGYCKTKDKKIGTQTLYPNFQI